MSRAFVKEEEGEPNLPSLRVSSPHPNYITQVGFEALSDQVHALVKERERLEVLDGMAGQGRIKEINRDLAYLNERLARAIVIRRPPSVLTRVQLGATVTFEDETGARRHATLVGEDEADAGQGLISWVSPLGKALMGQSIGDQVTWRRPLGDTEIEIIGIACSERLQSGRS